MRIESKIIGKPISYRVVIVTLDSHSAGPCDRAAKKLVKDFPGLTVEVHAAAQWGESSEALNRAKTSIEHGDIIIVNLLFLEEHVNAILPSLEARRDSCDVMGGVISDGAIVRLTRMGELDMSSPQSTAMKLLRKLRGSKKSKIESGEKRMKMLRSLPRILKFIPGKAQDLRAWFMLMQYWLGGSDDNIESMIRFLISKYCRVSEWRGGKINAPLEYPEVGLYHPKVKGRIFTDLTLLPENKKSNGTVGLLLMRSYVLSSDTAHYDAVIEKFEVSGFQVIPVFAGGLDARPAIELFFKGKTGVNIDCLVSLTGFSLVGGPAYNDSDAAVAILKQLNVPYISAHPLEFQTISQWEQSSQGLGPIETTMLVALPELDGATNPTVFAGRVGIDDSKVGAEDTENFNLKNREMMPCWERIEKLVNRVNKICTLRRKECSERKIAIVLFGFPPNSGAAGTAAYLNVFESLFNTLKALAARGYSLSPPETVEELREMVLEGTAKRFGQEANVEDSVSADEIVQNCKWLEEIERQWGPAPGRIQSDGKSVFILGKRFGNIFVGLQPSFGYEGDPMRLLFERGFSPSHAFTTFYNWLAENFCADAILHFGMHGALEFMPGKQTGLTSDDWPDRLIGDSPNIYLYASNNPSEASLAKRRSNAVIISHLTPPLASAGLYKGLSDLKDSLMRWRKMSDNDPKRSELMELISEQADQVDMDGSDPGPLWLKLLETEEALVPDGLHIVGTSMNETARSEFMQLIAPETHTNLIELEKFLKEDYEIPAILKALNAEYIAPVPGGDLIRSTDILPTGRNIHAFDPFRMPTQYACRQGFDQAELLLKTHAKFPRSIALVLWGSDNIKSDGIPIAQALALIGAKPRFDSFGRLSGADLISLEDLGRPRVDVIITLSGIFRDLLPLQTRLLAEAAYKAAIADEPEDMNFIRAHSLTYSKEMGVNIETAALRVFSNAEGTYGSNVNQLVNSSAFDSEDELADAYESRKSFAYGTNGKVSQNSTLLQKVLKDVDIAYQNLESIELGVTSVDHYFDTLGGISRAVKRAKGHDISVYIGDQTRGAGKVRSLSDQVALETRSRSLNPKFYESLLTHGAEGVRQIEAHVTNTLGWSATTGQVQPWVYQRLSETFMLDDEMRRRMAEMNPTASLRMANRLIEAQEREYWTPDQDTIDALRRGAMELEDKCEGISIAAE